jgi:hypothetical protein
MAHHNPRRPQPYVTGSQIFKDGTTENVIWLLDQAIHEYAKPSEILTDRGS